MMGEYSFIPLYLALDGFGIRIEQELGRVASMPICRIPRTMNSVTVTLTRLNSGQKPIPAEANHFRKIHMRLTTTVVEKTQLYPPGHLREDGEIDATFLSSGSQWIGLTREYLHGSSLPRP